MSFANLADITNNVNVRYLWNIHACTPILDNLIIVLSVMKSCKAKLSSCTVKVRIDSSVLINKPYAITADNYTY